MRGFPKMRPCSFRSAFSSPVHQYKIPILAYSKHATGKNINKFKQLCNINKSRLNVKIKLILKICPEIFQHSSRAFLQMSGAGWLNISNFLRALFRNRLFPATSGVVAVWHWRHSSCLVVVMATRVAFYLIIPANLKFGL